MTDSLSDGFDGIAGFDGNARFDGKATMNTCTDARPLIMSYLDGELSEAQAAPLRKHLLECQPCRGSAQDQKNVRRWFQAADPVVIPKDFAARVARRAFQGDRGEVLVASAAQHELTPPTLAPARAHDGRSSKEGQTLRFVLTLTAIAAALVFCVAEIGRAHV